MPLSTIFQLYRDGQSFSWRKPEYPEEKKLATSYWQTLSHNVVLSTPRHEQIQTHKVSGDCNYHTITTTIAPAE